MSMNFSTLNGLVTRYSPSGQERVAVEWLVGRMRDLGYSQAFIDDAGNAIGVMGNGPRQVVLLGHIDTVTGEIPVRINAGVLHGRGSVDAKGPLACFVDSVAKLGVLDDWQFVVIGAVDEERHSLGARYVVDKYSPDFAIVGEPNNWDRIALGYKGSAWANVTVRRQQSHTASGEKTAAEAAVEIWLAIKASTEEYNLGKERAFDQVLLTLSSVETEEGDFEQLARLKVGARLPVGMPPDEWYFELEKIATILNSFRISIDRVGYPIPAWKCDKNSPLVRSILNAIRSEGGTPRFVNKTGTADLNIVAPSWRCPTLAYGPGDSALDHTPNERIELAEYARAVNILSRALTSLASMATNKSILDED